MTLFKRLALITMLLPLLSGVGWAANCPGNPYTLTNGANADATQIMANFNNIINCVNQQPGLVFPPMGRLTLISGQPVLNTAVSGATTLYYSPDQGNLIPLWSGSGFIATTFTELSNVLANSASGNAGPSAAAADSIYDIFVWNNAGTATLSRGPAWSTPTSRSLTLARVSGVLTNTAAIANGPAAGFGTYVGTVLTDTSSGAVSFAPSASGAGGGTAVVGLWNAYNRRQVVGSESSTTPSWTVLSSTPREVQGGPFRVRFVAGLPEDTTFAVYKVLASTAPAASANGYVGLGLDATATFDQATIFMSASSSVMYYSPVIVNQYQFLVGKHFIAALESSDGVNIQTFYGGLVHSRLAVTLWY